MADILKVRKKQRGPKPPPDPAVLMLLEPHRHNEGEEAILLANRRELGWTETVIDMEDRLICVDGVDDVVDEGEVEPHFERSVLLRVSAVVVPPWPL